MSEVLIIKNTFDNQGILEKLITDELKIKVVVKNSISECLEHLKDSKNSKESMAVLMPEIDSQFMNAHLKLEEVAKSYEYDGHIFLTKVNSSTIPKLISAPYSKKQITLFDRKMSHDLILRELKSTFRKQNTHVADSTHFPVPIFLLKYLLENNINSFPFDLYLGVRSKSGELIKRFRRGDLLVFDDLKKYESLMMSQMYILLEEEKSFFALFDSLHVFNEKNNYYSNLLSGEVGHILLRTQILSSGIDPMVSRVVDDYFHKSVNLFESQGTFKNILDFNKIYNGSLHYGRSLMLAIILNRVFQKLSLDMTQFMEKVILSSLMHDMLIETDEHLLIKTNQVLKNQIADKKEEFEKVYYHAMRMSLLLEDYHFSHKDTITIVREHHGLKDGIGFTETLNMNINPLSMTFMVCEEFVDSLLQLEHLSKGEIKKMISQLKFKYCSGQYIKTVKALELIFVNN